jgi:hypothetical protein
MTNNVGSGSQLFFDALHATQGASQGKPVWVSLRRDVICRMSLTSYKGY